MKKNSILIIGGVLLVLFICFLTILCYKMFDTYSSSVPSKDNSDLEVSIDYKIESNNAVQQQLFPLNDDEGKQTLPFQFSVTNKGEDVGEYFVKLREQNDDIETSLNRKQLRYELKCNGSVLSYGSLDNIEDNILDKRSVKNEELNSYELRIWLMDSVTTGDWENKSYFYTVDIVGQNKEAKK